MYILENSEDKILVEKICPTRFDIRFQNLVKIISGGAHFMRFRNVYYNKRGTWFFDSIENTKITPLKGKLIKALYGI